MSNTSIACPAEMNADAWAAPLRPGGAGATLVRGRAVIRAEAAALLALADGLDEQFAAAAALLAATRSTIVVSGVGKSWLVGTRLSGTLNAMGTPSSTLHPTEALHGDLGRLRRGDVLLVLSNSGETPEVLALIDAARLTVSSLRVVAVTGRRISSLAQAADIVIDLGSMTEVCPLGLVPTTSAVVMSALGDALSVAVAMARGFTAQDFARLHPGGQLGAQARAGNARRREQWDFMAAALNSDDS